MHTIATLRQRGRLGTYTVTIHDAEDATPLSTELVGGLSIRYGGGSRDVRTGLLKSLVELELDDPSGDVRTRLLGPFALDRYEVRVQGPGIEWAGLIAPGRRERPAAPRLTRATSTIRVICGLAQTDAWPSTDGSFDALCRVMAINSAGTSEVVVASDIEILHYGDIVAADEWERMQLAQTFDETLPDEQIPAMLEIIQGMAWRGCDGRWHVEDRRRIGDDGPRYTVGTRTNSPIMQPVTLDGTIVDVSIDDLDEPNRRRWETLSEGGIVRYDLDDEYNLLPEIRRRGGPSTLDAETRNDPAVWTVTGSSVGRPDLGPSILIDALSDGTTTALITVDALRIDPSSGLVARLTWDLETWQDASSDAELEVRLVLQPDSGLPTTVTADATAVRELTTAAFNDLRTIRIEAEGRWTEWKTPQLQLLDNLGFRIVTQLDLSTQATQWLPVDVEPEIPNMDINVDFEGGDIGETGPATGYRRAGGPEYRSTLAYRAAVRSTDQPAGTERRRGTLPGLYPPEARLRWSDGAETIVNGRRTLDLVTGTTEIDDVTIPTPTA